MHLKARLRVGPLMFANKTWKHLVCLLAGRRNLAIRIRGIENSRCEARPLVELRRRANDFESSWWRAIVGKNGRTPGKNMEVVFGFSQLVSKLENRLVGYP